MTRRAQAGYTLVELMVAGLVASLVMVSALAMLVESGEIAAEMRGRLALNSQARGVFQMLANGGLAPGGALGSDGTGNVYGLRARNAPPAGPLHQRYRMVYDANGLQVSGDQVARVKVNCTGVGTPLPDCTSASQTLTVEGWIGRSVAIDTSQRSVDGRTAETGFVLVNPWLVRRGNQPASRAREDYATIFTLKRMEPDP